MKATFDIAVLGAGPAGANAALAAANRGLKVALFDEQPKPGGQVWRAKSAAITAAPNTRETLQGDKLRQAVSDSTVVQFTDTRVWQIERHDGMWRLNCLRAGLAQELAARVLIIATGAREYVQPIPGWTTPGVIGLAGATALFKQELIVPGKNTVVAGTGPLVFFVASEIRRLGGKVAAVVTPNTRMDWLRSLPEMLSRPGLLVRGGLWIADLTAARVPIYWGHAVRQVRGDEQVSGVSVSQLSTDWSPQDEVTQIEADSLCLGNGLQASYEAAQMLGMKIQFAPELGGWVPEVSEDGSTEIEGLYLCGDGCGIRGADAAVLQGQIAGLKAAEAFGKSSAKEREALHSAWKKAERFGKAMTALSIPRPGLSKLSTPDTIICRCENLSRRNIETEISSGAESPMAVKSGLRAGMGPCGGKFCQTAVSKLIARSTGQEESQICPATPRPPLRPVSLGAAAGEFDYDMLPIPKPAPL